MQLILQDDVPELGNAGTVVTVRNGYARNYLLPQKLAVLANPENLKALEHQRRVVTAKQAKLKQDAEVLATKLRTAVLKFTREAGEDGKLFGSVTTGDITQSLETQGLTVDRRRLSLPQPIKTLGEFAVIVRLHSEVHVELQVAVQVST